MRQAQAPTSQNRWRWMIGVVIAVVVLAIGVYMAAHSGGSGGGY